MPSDPQIDDLHRTGDDLIKRILELIGPESLASERNGWRPLLHAAGVEIELLRRSLRRIELIVKEFQGE